MFTLTDPLLSLVSESSFRRDAKPKSRPIINYISSNQGSYLPITLKSGSNPLTVNDIVIVTDYMNSKIKVKLIELVSEKEKEKIILMNWLAQVQ